jgi:pyruvate dehydrogenase E2 component (dihydrolipoamide acetyltransferase)
MRRTIGARLVESKRAAPHFYLSIDIELDVVVAFRRELKRALANETPTVNDCVIAAAARALRDVPSINARVEGGNVRLFRHVNVGVAVALATGLVVPVLKEADKKTLVTLSEEMATLAARARTNRLTPDDYRGGTFTVSNLGMFGIKQFVAILNPPQAGILALGQGVPQAVVRNGEIRAATLLTATLSADHRVVDGVVGAQFLQALQEHLQHPESLMTTARECNEAAGFAARD